MKDSTILYVARHDGSDVRVNKEIKTLTGNDQRIITIVNGFANGDPYNNEMVNAIELTCKVESKIVNILYLYMYYLYILIINRRSIRSLHLVDEETICIAIVGKLLRKRIVLDLFDSVALKFSNSIRLKKIIALIVSGTYKMLADCILYTDKRRLELGVSKFTSHKSYILQNYPCKTSLPDRIKNFKHDLMVSGTLYKDRGIDTIIDNPDIFERYNIAVLGWLKDIWAERLIQFDNITYYGLLSAREALHISAQCKCNFVFYNPNNLNNIYASPNKVYDSLALGQKIWCNQELKILHDLSGSEGVYTSPYNDVSNAPNLHTLLSSSNNRNVDTGYFWECVENILLTAHGVTKYVKA